MKTLFAIIAAFGLVASVQAQFTMPPNVKQALTNSNVLTVEGSMTTNIVLASKHNAVQVGANGIGIAFNFSGTNSATTTNCTFRFDVSGDGVNWVTTALTATAAPNGTTYTPTFTNIVSTAANVGNLVLIRLASIQNTNLASIFITNLTYSTR